jgi:pSer/pThr/pTyr-binding forkhead associated (FHA) protein
VRRDWSGTHVEDLGSRNGIKLNKKRTRKATIKDRDELEIGGVRLLFIDPSEVREDPVVLPSSTSDDEGEGTLSVKQDVEESPPSVEVKQDDVEPEKKDEPPPEEPPAENASTDAEAPADDGAENPENPEEPEPQPDDQGEDAGPRKLIDFSNKQHLIALGIGGAMIVMGVVLIILLVAGA